MKISIIIVNYNGAKFIEPCLTSIFESHFSSDAAALSVPSVPSVACSTPVALAWDKAFKNQNDPSGRAVSKVHEKSY